MQGYVWQRQYAGIFLRWCSGYLNDLELVSFLKTAANHLQPSAVKTTRYGSPGAFIFVFDNVLGPKERAVPLKGQRLRRRCEFEALFAKAKLLVHKSTAEVKIHPDYRPIVVWALH